jgi:multidrug efflux system membrane fusion protein
MSVRRTAPSSPSRLSSAVLAGIVLLTLAACSAKDAPVDTPAEEEEAIPVRTAPSTSGPAGPSIGTNGLIASEDEMRLSFKTGGIIRRLAVREGDVVRKGQLLAELELAEVGAQAEQADQAAAKAERDLERGERLHADQVISLETLQNLRTQAAVARAGRKAARFNLGYSTIVAPRDGRVLRRLAEEREFIPPGQPVVVLGSAARGHVVRTGLADREIVRVALGDIAEVRLDAYPDRVFPATVSEVAAAADPRNGLFPVEVRIAPETGVVLATGLVAKVDIVPAASRRSTLTHIPIAALIEGRGDQASVFVLDGAVARKRAVTVAFFNGERVALTTGLKPDERVITEGALYLQDGDRVRIVADPSPAASTPRN